MPLLIALLALLVFAPASQAAWFGLEAIDGPSADIERLGGVDLARDGTGGLVYVKRDGGVPHVYLSRLHLGRWQAPERLDGGLELAVSEAAVAAADSHRLAVTWIAGSRLYGVSYAEAATPGAKQGPKLLYEDPEGRALSGLAMDMGINGTGWATFTASGVTGGDVRAVRLVGSSWEVVPGALDVDPARDAGNGASRSRVAVAADGNPVVVWGEAHADGRRRAYARRIYDLRPSSAPQQLSLESFGGAAGGDADSADIDIEWDGSYAWAAWRQDIGGASRVLARRLLGSTFDPATIVDGQGPGTSPRVAINGRGAGFVTAAVDGQVLATQIEFDKLREPERVDVGGGLGGSPLVAASDNDNTDTAVVWRQPDGGLRGRYRPFGDAFEPEAVLSGSESGPVAEDAMAIAADRSGNVVLAAMTGEGASRRIAAAVYDLPPGTPVTSRDRGFQRDPRPAIRWRSGLDLWGAQSFRVLIDGQDYALTADTRYIVDPPLADGWHTWQIIAVDQRGQEKPSRVRKIGVDFGIPRISARFKGKRKAGRKLRLRVRGFDGDGSGVHKLVVNWGDRTPKQVRRRSKASWSHRFARAGRYRVKVTATDKVGNRSRKIVRLKVRR